MPKEKNDPSLLNGQALPAVDFAARRAALGQDDQDTINLADKMGGGGELLRWKILQGDIKDPNDSCKIIYPQGIFYTSTGGNVLIGEGEIIEHRDNIVCAVPWAMMNARSCWRKEDKLPYCWSNDGILPDPRVAPGDCPSTSGTCKDCQMKAFNRQDDVEIDDDKKREMCKTSPIWLIIMAKQVGDSEWELDPAQQYILNASFFSVTTWSDWCKTLKAKQALYNDFLLDLRTKVEVFGKKDAKLVAGLDPKELRPLNDDEYDIVIKSCREIRANGGYWDSQIPALAAATPARALTSKATPITSPADAVPYKKQDFGSLPPDGGTGKDHGVLIANIDGIAKQRLNWDHDNLNEWVMNQFDGRILETMTDDQIRHVTHELGEVIAATK